MFKGDAEAEAEHDILESGMDIKADVLKVGHHGSATSTTANILRKVSPDYAVISVGNDNRYGHPDPIIINRLNLHDVATMQTNEMGTIILHQMVPIFLLQLLRQLATEQIQYLMRTMHLQCGNQIQI